MHVELTFSEWLTLYSQAPWGIVESSTPPRPAPESPWPVWEVWISYLENCANASRQTDRDRQRQRQTDNPLYRYRYSRFTTHPSTLWRIHSSAQCRHCRAMRRIHPPTLVVPGGGVLHRGCLGQLFNQVNNKCAFISVFMNVESPNDGLEITMRRIIKLCPFIESRPSALAAISVPTLKYSLVVFKVCMPFIVRRSSIQVGSLALVHGAWIFLERWHISHDFRFSIYSCFMDNKHSLNLISF